MSKDFVETLYAPKIGKFPIIGIAIWGGIAVANAFLWATILEAAF